MVDIYKDMLEKLKYHKELVMNKFIKNGYYPSIEEVNNTIKNTIIVCFAHLLVNV